jgi:ribosomal protein L37AE/L43A
MKCNNCESTERDKLASTQSGIVWKCNECGLEYREFTCEPRNVYVRPDKLREKIHIIRQEDTINYLLRHLFFRIHMCWK